jgi:hypothetical protein
VTITGNVFVNCNDFKLTSGTSVTFTGGNVVFKGTLTVNNSTIAFNGSNPASALPGACTGTIVGCTALSSSGAAFVYFRSGGLTLSQSTVRFDHTVVYEQNGGIDIGSGSTVRWSAPSEGPFAGLALWSESSSRYTVSSGVDLGMSGTYFAPNADPFTLGGGATPSVQHAQFVTYRLKIAGGASLGISPDANTAVPVPGPGVALIC